MTRVIISLQHAGLTWNIHSAHAGGSCPMVVSKNNFSTTVPAPWYLRWTIYPKSLLKACVATLCTAGQTACIRIITFLKFCPRARLKRPRSSAMLKVQTRDIFERHCSKFVSKVIGQSTPKTEDGPHKIGNAIMRRHLAIPCVMCKLLLAGMQHGRKHTSKPR